MFWVMSVLVIVVVFWEGKILKVREFVFVVISFRGRWSFQVRSQFLGELQVVSEFVQYKYRGFFLFLGVFFICWVRVRVRSRCSVVLVKCRFCFRRRFIFRVVRRVGRMGSLRVICSYELLFLFILYSFLVRCRFRIYICWGLGVKMGKREGSRVGEEEEEQEEDSQVIFIFK